MTSPLWQQFIDKLAERNVLFEQVKHASDRRDVVTAAGFTEPIDVALIETEWCARLKVSPDLQENTTSIPEGAPLTKMSLQRRLIKDIDVVAWDSRSVNNNNNSFTSVISREGSTIKIRVDDMVYANISDLFDVGNKEMDAALVSGVSGSGKTMYASRILPRMIRKYKTRMANAQTVTTLVPTDTMSNEINVLRQAQVAYDLAEAGQAKERAWHNRATAAVVIVKKLLFTATHTTRFASGEEEHPEGIIFVIDEIGLCLDLAKAVISSLSVMREHIPFPVFFIFAGTSLDFVATTCASPSPRTSGTATIANGVMPSEVIIIEMRDVDSSFWRQVAQDMANRAPERKGLPDANEALLDIAGRTPIVRSLRGNARAGWLALEWIVKNSQTNNSNSDIANRLQELLQHVGSEYRKQNGLSRLSEPALQDYIHKAMDLVMKNQGATSEEIDESATEEIEMMNVARIGLVYFDYVERRPKMPLAIAAMCLSTFGVSTAPAVGWSTFESIVATHCHLTALAQGQLIETIALASQFPAKVSTDKDITNMNRIQFAERIEETWSRLGDKAKKHRKSYSLVVLNGPRAPFADVFVLRSTGVVEVIQCKRYKGSTVRKFGDSAFHEEVLKLGLHCNKPDEPNAEELAVGRAQGQIL